MSYESLADERISEATKEVTKLELQLQVARAELRLAIAKRDQEEYS